MFHHKTEDKKIKGTNGPGNNMKINESTYKSHLCGDALFTAHALIYSSKR